MQVKKSFVGKRPQTRLALTRDGERAWHEHLAALRAITEGPADLPVDE